MATIPVDYRTYKPPGEQTNEAFFGGLTPGTAVTEKPGYTWNHTGSGWEWTDAASPATPAKPGSTGLSFMPTAAPTFTPPTFGVVDPYQGPAPFQAPGAEGMYADPGYQFRVDQGRKALESSRAAQGIYRGGGTLDALTRLNQDYGSQEYQQTFNRAKDVFDRGERTAGDAYDRSRINRDASYDAAFRGAEAAHAPVRDTWAAQQVAAQHNEEGNWNRAYDQQIYDRNDAFRRWQQEMDAAYKNRTFASDDEFRRYQSIIQQGQFLAQLGSV